MYMKKQIYISRKCVVCGKVIIRKNQSQSQWAVAKFCSKDCWSKRGQRQTKNCNYCGKEFSLPAHIMRLGHKREKRACSIKCSYLLNTASRSHLWKGEQAIYNNRFRDALCNTNLYRNWRKEIKSRDNNKCVNCGATKDKMHVHHIYPLAQIIEDEGWNMQRWLELHDSPNSRLWDTKNGVTICSDCHYSLISFALQEKGFSPQ